MRVDLDGCVFLYPTRQESSGVPASPIGGRRKVVLVKGARTHRVLYPEEEAAAPHHHVKRGSALNE